MSTLITTTAQIGTIKDAGGNQTAMTIDSSGRVLMPEVPRFKSRITTATAFGSQTKMPIRSDYGASNANYVTTTGTNRGGGFDNTNNKYVVPITGLWQLNAQVGFYNNNTPSRIVELLLFVDGTAQNDLYWVGSHNDGASYPDYDGVNGCDVAYLTAGQEIELYASANQSVTAMTDQTGLSGVLIG
jgi:hypothetical protein